MSASPAYRTSPETNRLAHNFSQGSNDFSRASLLSLPAREADRAEVFDFLARRPLHTAYMSGLIRDNGLLSLANRGTFYTCRNAQGRLEGVALIGHATMFETRTDAALARFARLAREYRQTHMLIGEQESVRRFWQYYAEGGQSVRMACREMLFEQRWPLEAHEAVHGLRPATLEDFEPVVELHARLAYEESGVNPLEVDAEGFRERCAQRVARGRVWVWREGGRLIFKADVVAETPEVNYLEGVYVRHEERGRGYGLRCLSQLTRNLLRRTKSVTLFANEQNAPSLALYARAGFRRRGAYDTIFLQKS